MNLEELYLAQRTVLDNLREELKEAEACHQKALEEAAVNHTPVIETGPSPEALEEKIRLFEGLVRDLQEMVDRQAHLTPTVDAPESQSREAEFAVDLEDQEALKQAKEDGLDKVHEALVGIAESHDQHLSLADAVQKDVVGTLAIAGLGAAMVIQNRIEAFFERQDQRIEKSIESEPSRDQLQADARFELSEKHDREKQELADALKEQKKAFDERHADKSDERRAELDEMRREQAEQMRRDLEARQLREIEERAKQIDDPHRNI